MLYVAAGTIDLVQFVIGLLEVPLSAIAVGLALIAANEAADPFIGLALLGYFEIKGVKMITHWNRALSLLCVGGVDELTGGIASFWILDVWYIQKDLRKEDVAIQATQEGEYQIKMAQGMQKQLYMNGRRNVSNAETNRPAYANGSRAPLYGNSTAWGPTGRNGTSTGTSGNFGPLPQNTGTGTNIPTYKKNPTRPTNGPKMKI